MISARKFAQTKRETIQNLYADWFTDPKIREDSEGSHGKTKIDKLLKETWVVHNGTIEMLAFMLGGQGLYFLFAAGGEYYFWADHVLKNSKRFASHQEFVDHVVRADGTDRGLTLPDVEVPQAVETNFMWWFDRAPIEP
ncbi:hypothetical protein FB45DRAFT_1018838 [Roridomyces roridus]|uniref:Uncharacterized protein n=1 Tax=Roridomyces roridus TaxID=1738132 RepID=A0AAD7CE36_9AGAR|nr:hypothetical protein FB45DRAFT_1018838 [Roridomyces roridus]